MSARRLSFLPPVRMSVRAFVPIRAREHSVLGDSAAGALDGARCLKGKPGTAIALSTSEKGADGGAFSSDFPLVGGPARGRRSPRRAGARPPCGRGGSRLSGLARAGRRRRPGGWRPDSDLAGRPGHDPRGLPLQRWLDPRRDRRVLAERTVPADQRPSRPERAQFSPPDRDLDRRNQRSHHGQEPDGRRKREARPGPPGPASRRGQRIDVHAPEKH